MVLLGELPRTAVRTCIWVLTGNALPWGAFVVVLTVVLLLYRPRFFHLILWTALHIGIATAVPSLWERLYDYQRRRIIAFLNPGSDPMGAGYQVLQSKVAIGSGGFWGKGFMKGTQTGLAFVPARHTDFISAVVGEELGLFGMSLVLALFGMLIWRSMNLAGSVRSRFLSFCIVGAASLWAFQATVNIGMALGIMPVTGLPLPFLSYGGSSMLTHMALVGLVLNANPTLLIQDEGRGDPPHASEPSGYLPSPVHPHGIVHPEPPYELPHPVLAVQGYPHNSEALVFVSFVELHEAGNLGPAGGTPGRPEVEYNHLSLEALGCDRIAVQHFQGEGRGQGPGRRALLFIPFLPTPDEDES